MTRALASTSLANAARPRARPAPTRRARGAAARPLCAAGSQKDAQQDLDPRQWLGGGFDPDGLLGGENTPLKGGHFARRGVPAASGNGGLGSPAAVGAALAAAQAGAKEAGGTSIQRIPAEAVAAGGLTLDDAALDLPALRAALASRYMEVDLDRPGVRVLNIEPPVLTVDDFIPKETCDALVSSARESGALAQSAIGDAVVGSQGNAVSSRRTSSTMLVDDLNRARYPGVSSAIEDVQTHIRGLLPAERWSKEGKLPPPGSFCFEMPQVARYQPGQHFLAHEDGFPTATAEANKFQRRATVLVYLNDVAEGGKTSFEELGVAATPAKGRALLFFPSTADGAADPRTLHTATDAVDEKWVTQQWVAWGMPAADLDPQLAKLLATAGGAGAGELPQSTGRIEARLAARKEKFEADNAVATEMLTKKKGKKGKKSKSKGGKARKGFGA